VNDDGSYSILYDDGDKEPLVARELIEATHEGGTAESPATNLKAAAAETRKAAKADKSAAAATGNQLQEGSEVEARHGGQGKFFPGKIAASHGNDKYDVTYEDGDQEKTVSRCRIRQKGDKARESLSEGETVDVRHGGGKKYFPGKIDKVNDDGSYSILYDDGDKEPLVARELIEATHEGGTAEPGNEAAKEAAKETAKEETPKEEPPKEEVPTEEPKEEPAKQGKGGGSKKLQEGDQCEARHGGGSKWYKGTIMRCRLNGSYDIKYDDGDKEQGVKADLVRGMGGGEEPSKAKSALAEAAQVSKPDAADNAAAVGLKAAAAENMGGGSGGKKAESNEAAGTEEEEETAVDAAITNSLKEAAAEIQQEGDQNPDSDADGDEEPQDPQDFSVASSMDITDAVLKEATKETQKVGKKSKKAGGGMDVEQILRQAVLETSADADDLNKSIEDVLKEATAEVNNGDPLKGALKEPVTEVDKMAQKLVSSARNKKHGRSVEFELNDEDEGHRRRREDRRSRSSRSKRSKSPRRISRKKAEKELKRMGVDAPPSHHDGKIAYRDFIKFITNDDDPASGVEEDDELANKIRRRLRRRYDVNLPRLFRRLDPTKSGFVFARDFMKLLKALELRLATKEIRSFTRRFDQGAAPEKLQEYRMLVSCVQARALAPKKASLKHSRLLTLAQPKGRSVKKTLGEEELELEAGGGKVLKEKPESKYGQDSDRRHCHFTFKARKDPSGETRADDGAQNFAMRQETKERKRIYEYTRARKEAEYNVRLDKMMCPECGQYQSYDEMTNRKRFCTKCQADDKEIMYTYEGGGWAKVGKGFLRRQAKWDETREKKLKDVEAKVDREYKEWKPEDEDPLFAVTREYGKNEYDQNGAWKGGAAAEAKGTGGKSSRGPTPGRASLEAKWAYAKPDIIERTERWAEAKDAKIESLRKARVDEVMRDCPFEPQLSSDRGPVDAESWKTFNQRMDEDVRYRQARQHRIDLETKPEAKSLVFVPEPDPHPGKHTFPTEDLDYW
jgi:hypothetical protein